MAELKQITSEAEWEALLQGSKEKPAFLFKHSTTCPVSANAYKEYQEFATDLDKYYLIVSESRPVSNQVAEDLGIKHESPQIFLLDDGKAAWNTSHWNITEKNMKEALEENIK
ncbi:bacillithiol system redox-active protein YtxJ [Siminovitchia fortis]|uniref:bacillithiol system redox-active protein YtxJ n=1 Tax=Siminovitchia fortis TaxID=254758 RepID=UPI0011A4E69E|nr:bacillithiol system redox-active protein YtxJ [Siminovitchia fortis]